MSSGRPPELWPLWLEADIENLCIWSVEYDSAPTRWRGYAMPLVDRATNVLASFLTEGRLKQGYICFVTHSFGGLVIKELLRIASDRSSAEQDVKELVSRVSRIAFLGTPHLGADLATWARRFRWLSRPSTVTERVVRNDEYLRSLNLWYRRYATDNGIGTLTLIETRRTCFGRVVKPDSADPGLPSNPIPVDADHFGLASPESRESEVYRLVREFIKQPVTTLQPRNVVPLATLDAIPPVLERIALQLSATAISEGTLQNIPTALVDAEAEKRILRLRKMRFFYGSDHVEQASRLAHALLHGELSATSPVLKASILAWCARLLLKRPVPAEVLVLLDSARELARTEEVSIAEAFLDFYQDNAPEALGKLARLDTPLAHTASMFIVANTRTVVECLDWLRDAGLALSDLDADGKSIIIKKQLDAGKWQDALESATALQPSDFEQTPVLLYIAGGAHLVQAVPYELKTLILWHLPFEAAPIPLGDELASLAQRRVAN